MKTYLIRTIHTALLATVAGAALGACAVGPQLTTVAAVEPIAQRTSPPIAVVLSPVAACNQAIAVNAKLMNFIIANYPTTVVGKAPKLPKGYATKAHKIAEEGAATVRATVKKTADPQIKATLNRYVTDMLIPFMADDFKKDKDYDWTMLYDGGCDLPGVDDPEFTISF